MNDEIYEIKELVQEFAKEKIKQVMSTTPNEAIRTLKKADALMGEIVNKLNKIKNNR